MEMTNTQFFTVAEAAEEVDLTPGRVRQICREFDIGMFFGRDRMLTAKDVENIRSRPDRRKSEQTAQSS